MFEEHNVVLLDTEIQEICNIVNEIQKQELPKPLIINSICISCDEKKEIHEICIDCINKLIKNKKNV